ncbi:hypothetical protein [Litorimonas haliclonae]|uniref:hypothetical protein n=1 Tax=Litorimonas haliclonae TaxID=2081977 RepID=UPI0039EF680B
MSRKNLNRRHLNFLSRQSLARARQLQNAARALHRCTREKAEARRLSSVRAVAAKRSLAKAPCEQLSPPPALSNPPAPPAGIAPSASAPVLPKIPVDSSGVKNFVLRQDISEKVRQFLNTLSIKARPDREANYIAVWNQTLPGLGLSPERLAVYRATPPGREVLVEAVLRTQAATLGTPNIGTPL